ncbi:MAG TPA: DUF3613 domain-containing protein [Variovorax sp.]|nr:DUF3613 domain-containing protein [Variovorax sp.]
MKRIHRSFQRRLAAVLLSLASGPVAFLAFERAARAGEAVPVPPAESVPAGAGRVGDATAGLLALQREGRAASPVPRPIPGEVAGRSYQRYLKSFEQPIPERFGSSTGGGGAASGGAGR